MKKLLLIVCVLLFCASSVFAMDVTVNSLNAFKVQGPSTDFANWAKNNGATTSASHSWNDFTTFEGPEGGHYYSGVADYDSDATLVMPFIFAKPLATARLDYGAVCEHYTSNWGFVDIYIITYDANNNPTETLIFHKNGESSRLDYNYTQPQTPAATDREWRGYTDITNIVKGKTRFDMKVITATGWQAWYNDGGQFLPTFWTTTNSDGTIDYSKSDFYLTGTVDPIDVNSSNLIQCTADKDFTSWALNRGAAATNFSTFASNGATVSGATDSSNAGVIEVPIDHSRPIRTMMLRYSAYCPSNGDVLVEVIARTGKTTKIFEMNSDSSKNFNFTATQTPPAATDGMWAGYTDIAPIVAGKTGYVLRITCTNGGVFLPSTSTEPVLRITGSLQPDMVQVSPLGQAFSVRAPMIDFSDWAVSHGAISDNFETVQNGTDYVSSRNAGSSWAHLTMPFNFPSALKTARIDFSALCNDYGNNWGYASIDLVKQNGATTRIFSIRSNKQDVANYNYTADQTPSAGVWSGYTDISDLVAGETGFSLLFTCETGWSGAFGGGAFLPAAAGKDFVLTGTLAAAPVKVGLDNKFTLRAPVDDFTNWAINHGAVNNGFSTFSVPFSGNIWMSGTQSPSTWANINIPFSLPRSLVNGRLDYGATVQGSNSNYGHVMLDVIADGTQTNIFHATASAGEPAYNYTSSQTPSKPAGWWRGYTDITGLVAGKTDFNLLTTIDTGWDAWIYNGGEFLPDFWPDSDFYFTGEVAAPAAVAANTDNTFTLRGPADDFTKWAVARGGVASEDFTTFTNSNISLSGQQWPNRYAYLDIPFNFTKPLASAKIDFGAVCNKYGSNWGHVKVDIVADGVSTQVFYMDADTGAPNYNLTADQTPSEDGGFWRGYTDISSVVAGKKSFVMHIEVLSGWEAWTYNGGQFLPKNWADSDFILSGTLQGENVSIDNAKTKADGSAVGLNNAVVTAAFPDYFYIESPDRNVGIRVEKASNGLKVGDLRSVSGTIKTNANGERYIEATSITGTDTGSVVPVGMNNKAIGGGASGLQAGVANGAGLNNIGLLVKTWGKVIPDANNGAIFQLDDGSGVSVKCIAPSNAFPYYLYTYASVTGVVSCEKVGNELQRVILLRDENDFKDQ